MGRFQSDDGRDIDYKNALVQVEGKVVKISSAIDLKGYEGKEVDAEVDVAAGEKMVARLKIIKIV